MAYGLAVDNWASTVGTAHTAGDGQLVLSALNGLPALPAGRIYRVTAVTAPDTPTEAILGVFEATGRAGNALTGFHAASGYSDQNLSAGVAVQIRVCAATISELQAQLDSLATMVVTTTASAALVVLDRTNAAQIWWIYSQAGSGELWIAAASNATTAALRVDNAGHIFLGNPTLGANIISQAPHGNNLNLESPSDGGFYLRAAGPFVFQDNTGAQTSLYLSKGYLQLPGTTFQTIDIFVSVSAPNSVFTAINFNNSGVTSGGSRLAYIAAYTGSTPNRGAIFFFTKRADTDANPTAVAYFDENGNLNVMGGMVATGSGATGARPAGGPLGAQWYDATLKKPIWWDGAAWRDATGAAV
jgi:hypothetical protein